AACAGNPKTVCIGLCTTLGCTAVSGSTYSWTSNPSGFSSTAVNPQVCPTANTTYTVTETNSNGCINSNTVLVTVNPLPAACAGNPKTICTGLCTTVGCTAVSGSTYSW